MASPGTIAEMPADQETRSKEPSPSLGEEAGFLASQQTRESTSWTPWIVSAAVFLIGVAVLVLLGGQGKTGTQVTGTGMAPADPYAASLPITGLAMSESTSFSGAKVTYVDGHIANQGSATVDAITVQVGFHSETGEFAQRLSFPLSLIRVREPYVDTMPVSAAPIKPGENREFRLIFDAVPAEWNQQYPEIRIISVHHF